MLKWITPSFSLFPKWNIFGRNCFINVLKFSAVVVHVFAKLLHHQQDTAQDQILSRGPNPSVQDSMWHKINCYVEYPPLPSRIRCDTRSIVMSSTQPFRPGFDVTQDQLLCRVPNPSVQDSMWHKINCYVEYPTLPSRIRCDTRSIIMSSTHPFRPGYDVTQYQFLCRVFSP